MSAYSKPIHAALLAVISPSFQPRKPRRIVTRSGKTSRGNFPSLKSTVPVQYESQLELKACRVFEVASKVNAFGSQPASLQMCEGDGAFRYTPDFDVDVAGRIAIGEIKPDVHFLRSDVVVRLRRVAERFVKDGACFFVLLESDLLLYPGFQDDLQVLLARRPWRRWWIACDAASPLVTPNGVAQQAELFDDCHFDEAAWRKAQRVCDDLLDRVMKRDFDATIDQAKAAIAA